MGRSISFPNIVPTARSYKPAELPERVFKSINGSETRIHYGNVLMNAELSMTFANITERRADLILDNYYAVIKEDGNVKFQSTGNNPVSDIDDAQLQTEVEYGGKFREYGRLPQAGEWKYKSPPTLTFNGVNRVTVRVDLYSTVEGN